MPNVKSTNIEALLLEREARGLRVPVIARILLFLFILAIVLMSVQLPVVLDPWVWYVFIGLLSVSLLINFYFYSLLRRSKYVEAVGLAGATFDVVFVLVTFLSLQWAAPELELSLAFGWKSEIVLLPAVLIVINGLALRPRYPIVVAVGATLVQILCYVRVLNDPRTHFSFLPAESYGGTAMDPLQIPNTIAMVAAIGIAMAFITHVARKTIRQAIANELLNAELQREQLALLMREKVEALGKLVAGVSHEINGPAGVISSGVDTQARAIQEIEAQVSDRVQASKPLGRVIGAVRSTGEVMREASQRISNTAKSLRAFAHLDEADFQKVDLHREIDNALELIPAEIRGQTELQRVYGELPELYLQAGEISQALMTILQNAFEANGGTGTVVIRTEFQDDDVNLTVSDTGGGISPERLGALFDVSVRSKGGRMAAGFELAAAQSVAHRHGGEITVESELGQGSAFTLRLPVS
jgi:signal transduction histidine kinase